jgi:hypothetical protein
MLATAFILIAIGAILRSLSKGVVKSNPIAYVASQSYRNIADAVFFAGNLLFVAGLVVFAVFLWRVMP